MNTSIDKTGHHSSITHRRMRKTPSPHSPPLPRPLCSTYLPPSVHRDCMHARVCVLAFCRAIALPFPSYYLRFACRRSRPFLLIWPFTPLSFPPSLSLLFPPLPLLSSFPFPCVCLVAAWPVRLSHHVGEHALRVLEQFMWTPLLHHRTVLHHLLITLAQDTGAG